MERILGFVTIFLGLCAFGMYFKVIPMNEKFQRKFDESSGIRMGFLFLAIFMCSAGIAKVIWNF